MIQLGPQAQPQKLYFPRCNGRKCEKKGAIRQRKNRTGRFPFSIFPTHFLSHFRSASKKCKLILILAANQEQKKKVKCIELIFQAKVKGSEDDLLSPKAQSLFLSISRCDRRSGLGGDHDFPCPQQGSLLCDSPHKLKCWIHLITHQVEQRRLW